MTTTVVQDMNGAGTSAATSAAGFAAHAWHAGQMLLAALVIAAYGIEGPTFLRLFLLATAGFIVNLTLPLVYRQPFFVLLSFTGAFVAFGARDAAWLIACGSALIGICHLPLSIRVRVGVLILAGAALATARAGVVPSPWSAVVWPILGSMFMFRLVLYMLAMNAGVDRNRSSAFAYFFMLPNLAFPLFPVVDYQTFRRTYYDRAPAAIYEQGLTWIARGLVHLLLYRFVYHRVLNDPVDVVGLGDLVQFMIGTFLLYLRVSGQFHLIIGILHMFGFRLPETHKLYYLAHSFTELWRRINIYWTDFMMKAVFYPTYFRVKRMGPAKAMVVSTSAVFVTTWFLHSYQWFWLRGGLPITAQDTLFWGALGVLVVTGGLRELNATKKPMRHRSAWSWRQGLRAAATFATFCFLWSLWSTESIMRWIWMLGAAANVDVKGVVLLGLAVGTIAFLGGIDWDTSAGARPRWLRTGLKPSIRTVATLVVLLVAAQPALPANVPGPLAAALTSLQMRGLNVRDAALQHRGYYEQLELRAQPTDAQRAPGTTVDRASWKDLASTGVLRDRNDLMLRDLYASRIVDWNGMPFSTNQWGMRDQEYALQKPPETLRIALLGPSHVMGNGVADGRTFEALVEERLNRERIGDRPRVEILNFGVDGYSLPQQVAILEDRVLRFNPDIVIATHYQRNRAMTEGFLEKIVERGVPVPHEELRSLLTRAGLAEVERGRVPVPFASGRRLAKAIGLDPRIPSAETEARSRRIVDDVLRWSINRFAEVTRAGDATPAVLGLHAVIDDVPATLPNAADISRAGLPLLDLSQVFPAAELDTLRVAPWDEHPNARGHQLIADRLYGELLALLKSTDRRF